MRLKLEIFTQIQTFFSHFFKKSKIMYQFLYKTQLQILQKRAKTI